ncbi:diguanylate cyclase domain-containing protein [Aciditerrimonas ferrireducens]|uniref:diguanylate cyclase domain-containing protein n=1 Tax=Aciditerrimonas ferrireducens TaxID=667306 RepID=UPI002003919B|nr:diguanylate cyclase [Aciditerrimonas ferrireducens]MCK4177485.1 diguanylate cyclase [Aciditerrimonas ferrireducens]
MPLGLPAAPGPPTGGASGPTTVGRDALLAQVAWLARQLALAAALAGDPRTPYEPGQVLAELVGRVAETVRAKAHVAAAAPAPGDTARTWSVGLPPEEAAQLVRGLGAGRHAPSAELLVAPIASDRRHFGWLCALGPAEGAWWPTDQQTLEVFAQGTAHALETLAALHDLRHAESTARALLDLAHRLAQVFGVEEVAETLASAVAEVTQAGRASTWLWDPHEGALVRVAVAEPVAGRQEARATTGAERVALRPEDDRLAWQLVTTRSTVVADLEEVGPTVAAILRRNGCRWVAAVPVVAGGELLGAVTAAYTSEPPALRRGPGELVERLQGLADQAATAIANARLLSQMQHVAWHDPLTGLPNRRLLEDRTAQALRQAERTGQAVGLLFVDLDHFKTVNDTLGHSAGDQVVTEAADRLRNLVRTQDTVARFGGDELAILLPEVSDPAAMEQLAERALAALAEPYELPTGPLTVTASIGLASAPPVERSFAALLQAADLAMYEAKQAGRNRVRRASRPRALPLGEGATGASTVPGAALADQPLPCTPILRLADHATIGVLLEPAPTWPAAMSLLAGSLAVLASWPTTPPSALLPVPAAELLRPGHLHQLLRTVQDAGVPPERVVVLLETSTPPDDIDDLDLATLTRRLGRVGIRCALPWALGRRPGILEAARPAVVVVEAPALRSGWRPEDDWRGPLGSVPPARMALGLRDALDLAAAGDLGVSAATGPLFGPTRRDLRDLFHQAVAAASPARTEEHPTPPA